MRLGRRLEKAREWGREEVGGAEKRRKMLGKSE